MRSILIALCFIFSFHAFAMNEEKPTFQTNEDSYSISSYDILYYNHQLWIAVQSLDLESFENALRNGADPDYMIRFRGHCTIREMLTILSTDTTLSTELREMYQFFLYVMFKITHDVHSISGSLTSSSYSSSIEVINNNVIANVNNHQIVEDGDEAHSGEDLNIPNQDRNDERDGAQSHLSSEEADKILNVNFKSINANYKY